MAVTLALVPQEPAAARTSVGPAPQRKVAEPVPTGLLRADERLEVARTLDETRTKTARIVYVLSGEIVEQGASTTEDLDTTGSVVILVDPFEKKGSLPKPPVHSSLLIAKLRRGEYAEGLIGASNRLMDRLEVPGVPPEPLRGAGPAKEQSAERRDLEDLLEDRLRASRGADGSRSGRREGSGYSVVLVCAGTTAVILFVIFFLKSERYGRPEEPERNADFYRARRAAEEAVAALAPGTLLLAEREKVVARLLGGAGGEERREAERLSREADAAGFWRRFAGALALIEDDPHKALDELRPLPSLVEPALEKLEEVAEVLAGEEESHGYTTGGGRDARAR